MGDRANVLLVMPTSYGEQPPAEEPVVGLYCYTHWSGYEWPERLRQALEFGRGRWTDDQYLARIIVSRMFADLVDDETGGGVSLRIGDNEYPITVVDLANQTVSWAREGSERNRSAWEETTSFADFVAQEKADYPAALASH